MFSLEFFKPLICTAAARLPEQARGTFRKCITKPSHLLIEHKLRPVANRQVGSHPTVRLDIGMPYPPWNRIQLVLH